VGRRRAREFALQALYQADMLEISGSEAISARWLTSMHAEGSVANAAESDEVSFAETLVGGVASRLEELDQLIEKASVNWRVSRMPVVDRNILRMAAFELLISQDVPASVSINEAVELAKRFGDKESRAFVNGILDRIAQETGRGGRGKSGKRSKRSKRKRDS
jgi:N utilization substance protein B